MTAVSRYWRAFRRWRRARPFWGGLFLLLAGCELFLSANMDLGNLQVHVGPEGFLSYLLPLIEIACGLLVWLTPQHRLFYAIVAAITSVYTLIGLNLGGFLLGTLLGMVGAALAFGWQPRPRPVAARADGVAEGADEEPAAEESVHDADAAYDPAYDEATNPVYDAVFGDNFGRARHRYPDDDRPTQEQPATPDEQANHDQPPHRGGNWPGAGGAYVALLVLALAAGALAVLRAPVPAAAAPAAPVATASSQTPCPTAKPPPSKGIPPPKGAPVPTASPSASPSPGDVDGGVVGDVVGGVVGGLGEVLGGSQSAPAPTPAPAPAPALAPTPEPTPSATAEPGRRPPPVPGKAPRRCGDGTTGPDAGGKAGPNKVIAAAPDQPLVQAQPSKLTGSKVVNHNMQYDGLVDLPTYNGTIRAMQFSMDKSVTDDFKLLTNGPGDHITQLTSSQLTVDGDVKLYCTRFSGDLVGVAPVTFTVQTPPSAILVPVIDWVPEMVFTDPEIDLVFVDTDKLTADALNVKPRP